MSLIKVAKNIFKRGDKYYAQVMRRGKHYARSFERLVDAVRFIGDIKSGALAPQLMTFKTAANDWLEYAGLRKKVSSQLMDENRLNCYIFDQFGNMRLDAIKPIHIDVFIKRLKGDGLKDSTINRYLQTIKAVFNFHIKRQVVSVNPVNIVGMLRISEQSFDFWSFKETETFLLFTRQKYEGTTRWVIYLIYITAVNTGLRRSELVGLRWDSVDLKNRMITVKESYSTSEKKISSTKNRRIRHVPIPPALYDDLYKAWENSNGATLVFGNSDGNFLDPNNLYGRYFLKDIKESGVRKIRFHDLRHTFASHYLMNGGDIFRLQNILGHASINMTMRYAHLSKEHLESAKDVVNFGSTDKVVHVDFKQASGS